MYETHLQNLKWEQTPTKNSSTRNRLRQQIYEKSLTKFTYEISSIKSHLRELKYEDSLTKTHLHDLIHDNKPTETYLRELTYEKKPTRTYLQEKVYQNSLAISHLRQLNYKNLRLTKSFLGKHDYENSSRDLTYENKPTRTRLRILVYPCQITTSSFSHRSCISIVSGILKNIPLPYFSLVC